MKTRRYLVAGLAVLASVCITAYASLPQDSYYTYTDATGSDVGWKYVSCSGQVTSGGTITSTYTVEHTPC